MRVVRTEEGVRLDESGKMPGRGAYFCYNAECWEKGKKRLASSLKVSLSQEKLKEIEEDFEALLKRRNLIG